MLHSSAVARDILLIDIEEGTLLQVPPEVTVSARYVDSHPFISRDSKNVYVGPDAQRAGKGGTDYLTYEILRDEFSQLYLRRMAR